MNIDPYIFLGVGGVFAILYGCVITFGWARTRHNRSTIHRSYTSELPTLILDGSAESVPATVRTVSLDHNKFVDKDNLPVDVTRYKAYIAIGRSADYPNIESGDLVLKDANGEIRYVFSVPDLSDYR